MAASPGRASADTYKKSQEASYVAGLREIPIKELLEILPSENAEHISYNADNNLDFYDYVPEKSSEIRMNTAVYADDIEDFIDCVAVKGLIEASRRLGDHRSAEKVRILRSARAVIYITNIEGETSGV